MTSLTFSEVDEIEPNADVTPAFNQVDDDGVKLTCAECGDTFVHPAGKRGRKPANCPRHRAASRAKDADKFSPTGVRKVNNNVKKQAESLITQLGLAAAFIQPYDGAVILSNAEELADYLSELAAKYPAVRRFIDNAGDAGLIIKGIAIGAGIAVPIMWNHSQAMQNRIPFFIVEKAFKAPPMPEKFVPVPRETPSARPAS